MPIDPNNDRNEAYEVGHLPPTLGQLPGYFDVGPLQFIRDADSIRNSPGGRQYRFGTSGAPVRHDVIQRRDRLPRELCFEGGALRRMP